MGTQKRIYAIYSSVPALSEVGGDQINELATLTALSGCFDVYYNNRKFDPTSPQFGLDATTVEMPDRHYDLVYCRGNSGVFWEAKRQGIPVAYWGRYDPELFGNADAIAAFNHTVQDIIL